MTFCAACMLPLLIKGVLQMSDWQSEQVRQQNEFNRARMISHELQGIRDAIRESGYSKHSDHGGFRRATGGYAASPPSPGSGRMAIAFMLWVMAVLGATIAVWSMLPHRVFRLGQAGSLPHPAYEGETYYSESKQLAVAAGLALVFYFVAHRCFASGREAQLAAGSGSRVAKESARACIRRSCRRWRNGGLVLAAVLGLSAEGLSIWAARSALMAPRNARQVLWNQSVGALPGRYRRVVDAQTTQVQARLGDYDWRKLDNGAWWGTAAQWSRSDPSVLPDVFVTVGSKDIDLVRDFNGNDFPYVFHVRK